MAEADFWKEKKIEKNFVKLTKATDSQSLTNSINTEVNYT